MPSLYLKNIIPSQYQILACLVLTVFFLLLIRLIIE